MYSLFRYMPICTTHTHTHTHTHIYIYMCVCVCVEYLKKCETTKLVFTYRIIRIKLTKEYWPKKHFINKTANRELYIYIYIYIYIYYHPQIDCFVVSQLFSGARHAGRLKLGSKPAQLYVRLRIRALGQQAYHVS